MIINSEHRSRLRKERRHRDFSLASEADHPSDEGIGDNSSGRRLKAVQELLKWVLKFGVHGFIESRGVGGAADLGGNDLRDGDKAEVGQRARVELGGEEAEPLFSDDEGDEGVGLSRKDEVAEVEHRVYVASPWVWERHQVAVVGVADVGGAFCFILH